MPPDPCDADPGVPLVLLPVRLETRFTDDGAALRVRIYPDDVHVDRLDRGVAADERDAGMVYWRALWGGDEEAERVAFDRLAKDVHRERAAWIAEALRPNNIAERPPPGGQGPEPDFPDTEKRSLGPPVARALPDRFLVRVTQAGESKTVPGGAIAPEVVVGLPDDPDPAALVRQDGVTLGPGMEWMTSYGVAVDAGMAVTVELDRPGEPVESLLVFGVRGGLDAPGAAEELERLLVSHRFGHGAAIVPQGTPTNNTESDRSAWQRHPEPRAPATRAPAEDLPPDADAVVLARALGIDAVALRDLDGATEREQGQARAANTALWAASWGSFLQRLTTVTSGRPTITDEQREALRDLFQDHVRGRGPLPAIRLGDQPYGVLPVSAHDGRWQPKEDSLEPRLTELLRRARAILRKSLGAVPKVGEGALDDALLEVLGSGPQALGVRVRSIASKTMSQIGPHFIPMDGDDAEIGTNADWVIWSALGFDPSEIGPNGSLGRTTRPLGLPQVHESDVDYIKALLEPGLPRHSVQSVFQALLELAHAAEQKAAGDASSVEELTGLEERAVEVAGELAPRIRELVELAQHANGELPRKVGAEHLNEVASGIAQEVGESGPSLLATHQPLAGVRGSLSEVARDPALAAAEAAPLALGALGAWIRAQHRLAEFYDALEELAATSEDERRILLAEVLDTSSHRLDAWITAVVSRRLDAQRDARPDGATIGAYGWVEDLVQGSATTRNGGYLHAPSPAQARTAGILRSAHLTHNPAGAGQGAFAIDLTSARVRTAMSLAEGIAQGQQLGALLGYRFERHLHEHELDRFVLSVRAMAPLVAGKLNDRGETLPQPAQEAIAASNVVDGVRLLALNRQDIKVKLGHAPENNPYLDPNDWEFSEQDDWPEIERALDEVAAANDALADLMLAEGVHQLAQGNVTRAAAALDAAAGDAPPVEFDFVRTPPAGVALTHRLMLVAPDGIQGTDGWRRTAPRAKAEPRLERWVEGRLGAAGKIVLGEGAGGALMTLKDAALSALDFVFEAGTPALLEHRIRAEVAGLGDGPLAEQREASWPAGAVSYLEALEHAAALGRVLAAASPALPAAFARPSDLDPKRPLVPAIDAPALSELRGRIDAALGPLGQATTDLAGALGGGGDPGAALAKLAGYGIHVPAAKDPAVRRSAAEAALAEARRRVEDATVTLQGPAPGPGQPAPPPPEFDANRGIAAGKAIFGESFWMLPLVSNGGPALLRKPASTAKRPAPKPAELRRFVSDVASVRPGVAAYTEAMLIADATGAACHPAVAQLSGKGKPGEKPLEWIGKPFDSAHLADAGPVMSIVFDAPGVVADDDRVAGLVVDEWVEAMPRWRKRELENGEEAHELMQTTGVALNANAPGARAPQAILLAVSPDGERWTADALAATLVETLELSRLRAVTLERAVWLGRVLPALLEQSWSLQGEETMDITKLAMPLSAAGNYLQFVKEAGDA